MDTTTVMTTKELEEFIERHRWTFAKTMAHIPHEYVVRQKVRDDESFNRFVITIRSEGYTEYFGRKPFKYLNVGDYKYWTMGSPLEQTIIINRAKL